MIQGIHHISMKCGTAEEFAKAKDFYLGILGLSVKREWPEGIMIDTGNCMLEIFSNGEGPLRAQASDGQKRRAHPAPSPAAQPV